ncbi:carbonic anhydrase [Pseudomonas sp. R5(2019)]|uniref:carbonic anhydrase n=1 Tax=Pseudomonas sp. R5(2019) TaxID=2697566 RepID=UPI0014126DFF|nr:carbonic anhydrase [Pseudomonas sp. R5(2019)]NBA94382.1 carbonic anhydrase [Pseudomonas sp. R5(2019)]
MCNRHTPSKESTPLSRRLFLQLTGITTLATALPTWAAAPKPQNILNPDEALERLLEGNARYRAGLTRRFDFHAERSALSLGQNPFAAILSCADSRVAPEYAFDTARGDVFVVRVAGNFLTPESLGSLEYAVMVLGTPLLMVLGHDRCGAVAAAVKAVQDGTRFEGQIQLLADRLTPAVKHSMAVPGDLLDNAIAQNVRDTLRQLQEQSPLLAKAVAKGSLKMVAGIYRLEDGHVDLLQ